MKPEECEAAEGQPQFESERPSVCCLARLRAAELPAPARLCLSDDPALSPVPEPRLVLPPGTQLCRNCGWSRGRRRSAAGAGLCGRAEPAACSTPGYNQLFTALFGLFIFPSLLGKPDSFTNLSFPLATVFKKNLCDFVHTQRPIQVAGCRPTRLFSFCQFALNLIVTVLATLADPRSPGRSACVS